MGILEYQHGGEIDDTEANVYFLIDPWQSVDLTENKTMANKSCFETEKV